MTASNIKVLLTLCNSFDELKQTWDKLYHVHILALTSYEQKDVYLWKEKLKRDFIKGINQKGNVRFVI